MNDDQRDFDSRLCGESAAPYVLGALTEPEYEAFRRHLDSCAVCREEVAALQVVASALPAAAPQLSAPPELKRRLMASVREDLEREGADMRQPARRSVFAPGAPSAGAPARARLARARPRWRALLAPTGALVAVAAAVLAIVVLSSGGGAGGARVIRAEVTLPRASASLRVSAGHGQLNIAGMPQPARGRVYELWLKRSVSGKAIPTDALFTVAADGAASVGVPGGVSGVSEVMVTSEPLGGSRVPTLPVLIVARVA
jgi:hypothetical protein